jgi:hypothetical protein
MKFGYADPPYYGCAVKFYGDHPEAADYDTIEGHQTLVARLTAEFPDGWALCMTSGNLLDLVPHLTLPPGCRVAAWTKPFHAYKKGVRPAFSWEPVIFYGGRNQGHPPPEKGGEATTPKDHLAANITMRKGLTGAKPEAFNRWILDLLGWLPSDELVDLFPGTGGMGEVVASLRAQADLFAESELPAHVQALFEGDAA